MKYIRTKNGIYEVVEDNNKEWGKQIVVKFPKNLNMKLADVKDQILKQADTIEELCDGFYATENSCWEKDYYLFGNKDFEYFKDFAKDFPNGFARGFIATDKGLLFVAKMNEKGELELI